jgi:hypothetical protein
MCHGVIIAQFVSKPGRRTLDVRSMVEQRPQFPIRSLFAFADLPDAPRCILGQFVHFVYLSLDLVGHHDLTQCQK